MTPIPFKRETRWLLIGHIAVMYNWVRRVLIGEVVQHDSRGSTVFRCVLVGMSVLAWQGQASAAALPDEAQGTLAISHSHCTDALT